jgi:hypothetical protein
VIWRYKPVEIKAKKAQNQNPIWYKGITKNPTIPTGFEAKDGAKADCKISAVPVSRPKYPDKTLNPVICRGLGKDPLLLLAGLDSNDQRLCVTITKVCLMRWRIEEYYKFKKQGFGFEKFLVRSLTSIRSLDLPRCRSAQNTAGINARYDLVAVCRAGSRNNIIKESLPLYPKNASVFADPGWRV